jgi:hypothetical protein
MDIYWSVGLIGVSLVTILGIAIIRPHFPEES